MAEWKRRRYPQLAYGTQIQYEKMLRNHFGGLMGLPIHGITPKLVDGWMFPETFEAFKSLWREGATGLVFQLDGDGGCRRVFNHVGVIPIAQQLLGNSDLKTTLVYAKRHASALTKVAHDYWAKKPTLLATAFKPASES